MNVVQKKRLEKSPFVARISEVEFPRVLQTQC